MRKCAAGVAESGRRATRNLRKNPFERDEEIALKSEKCAEGLAESGRHSASLPSACGLKLLMYEALSY